MHTKVMQNHIKHSRILTITALTSTLLLSLLILTIYQPLYYHGKNEQKVIATTGSSIQATTSLSITTASNVAGVDLLVKDNNGTFASSDDSGNTLGFNVATDYHNGYTLSIASASSDSGTSSNSNSSSDTSNSNGKLIYEINSTCKAEDTCPAFNSISAASNAITTNGTWGYKPSKLNSVTNTNYLPSPTTTPTILDKTTIANTTGTANSYSIAIGAKADYTQIPGVYSNSYTLQAVVNIVEHAITFNKDDNITGIVIKDVNGNTGSSGNNSSNGTNNESNSDNNSSNGIVATITNNTDTINLIYGDTYTIELNFADNYELGSLVKSSGVGELTIDTSGSSTNITKATFTVGNGIATIDAKSKSSKVYMQDLTLEQCKQNVGTNGNAANIGDNITVYDRRDGSDYTVRYINGACWMTQNLRFTGTELDSTTSNVADTYTPSSPYYVNGSSVKAWKSLKSDSVCKGMSLANTSTNLCMQDSGNTTTGVWYNYAAASAETITGKSNSAAAVYSICPAGWRLPTGAASRSSSDLYGLFQNGSSGWKATNDFLTAFSAVPGGYYNMGAIDYVSYGGWWSATAFDDTSRYRLDYRSSDDQFASDNDTRRLGFFVRCARTS